MASMASRLCSQKAPVGAHSIAHCKQPVLYKHVICRASVKGSQQPNQQQNTASSSTADAPVQPIKREFTALGSKVVESNVSFQGPEDQPDFWEADNFDNLGKVLENYFIPGLIALGLVCGGIAAKTYNDGATEFVKAPTGPDAPPVIIQATPEGEPDLSSAPSILIN